MKVAIMTQPLGANYGGIMQAWALQQILKRAGHEPVTIDRRSDAKGPIYNAARLSYRTLQKILGKRQAPVNFERYLPYIQKNTKAFIGQHLSMSEQLDSTAKLKTHFEREDYDAVIVGSDQTWRPRYSPNIKNYFLDFLEDSDIRKIAYASSFGVDDWEFTEEQTRLCSALIKRFDVLGVRERSGVGLCQRYFGVNATHVLDPTLLIQKKSYELLYKSEANSRNSGVYTYILDPLPWKQRVAEVVKNKLGEPLYNCQSKKNVSSITLSDYADCVMPSVESWLEGFSNSAFVITDSFHGTVFSIIFNKPFISLVNPSRGASRFYSISEQLGLSHRFMSGFNDQLLDAVLAGDIDYENVNKKLAELRNISNEFLTNALMV